MNEHSLSDIAELENDRIQRIDKAKTQRRQRKVLLIVASAMGVMCLFPPRAEMSSKFDYRVSKYVNEYHFYGYRFLLDPWHSDKPIAFKHLFGEMSAVLIIGGVLILAFRFPN